MIFSGKEKEEFIRLTHEVEVLAKQKAELTREKQELEKALAQLKYNDSVFSNFRANISLPLVLFDNTLKIIYANHKAAQYFELPINNIIGNNFYKLYSPESQGSYQDIDSFFTAELEGKIDKVIKGVGNHQKNITLIDFNKVLDNAGKLSFGYIFFTEYRDPAGRSYLKDSRTNILAPPRNVRETGLSMDFIGELILKLIYSYGEITNLEISEELCLPLDEVIQPVMTFLKKDLGFCANVAVTEENVGRTDQYINILTDMGRERVREALDRNQYVGPAPITLELYKEIVIEQMGTPRPMKISEVKESLSHMVFDDKMFKKLTTAINSRGSIFLHGEPGNGKSSISKVCSRVNKNYVILPYAIEVEGQIIKVFDSIYHKQLSEETIKQLGLTDDIDKRWAICEPPLITLGGELALEDLELNYDPVSKFYEAPSQIKANGGTLVIDDFGRQKVSPGALLNRWMVPLEEKLDFMRLHTGKQIIIPMDILLVFSTNIPPRDLGDEAFFRRLKNKIYVPDPNQASFENIFRINSEKYGFVYSEEIFQYLLSKLNDANMPLRGYIPGDILNSAAAATETEQGPQTGGLVNLTKEVLDEAFENCFI